jgi:group I intron endonuclease
MQSAGQMVYAVGANKKANGLSVGRTQPALSNGLFEQPAPVRILAHPRGLSKPIKVTGRFPFKASMSSGIYCIRQITQDRAVYVGSSSNLEARLKWHTSRLVNGNHSNRHLQSTWNKYGADDFQFLKLEDADPAHLTAREQHWMDTLKPACNLSLAADSPMRGRHHSEETRAKLSAAQTGKPSGWKGRSPDAATRAKIADAARGNKNSVGRIASAETRAKIGAAGKGRKASPETRARMSAASKGVPKKPLSPEHRAKLSAALKGRKPTFTGRQHSAESRAKMSAALKGKGHPNPHKGKPWTPARRAAYENRRKLPPTVIEKEK